MKIHILCSDPEHPVNAWLEQWASSRSQTHDVRLYRRKADLSGGDLLFLVSCAEVVGASEREHYRHVLVLHASDLPKGRGWSPHVWQLLEGATSLTVSLLNAEERVDAGAIWAKENIEIPRDALYDEINARLFDAEIALMDKAIELIEHGHVPNPQDPDIEPSHYPRRSLTDSEIDPQRPLAESFNKIRVMDADRFPAFFRLHGKVYFIRLKKKSKDENDPN